VRPINVTQVFQGDKHGMAKKAAERLAHQLRHHPVGMVP
jgi:hypothetical protein